VKSRHAMSSLWLIAFGYSTLLPLPAQLATPEASQSPGRVTLAPFESPEKVVRPTASPRSVRGATPKAKPSLSSSPAASPSANKNPGPYLSELVTILQGTNPLRVNLCFIGQGNELSKIELAHGASISEALALWAGFRPFWVSHEAKIINDRFNVAIGTVESCRDLIPPTDVPHIKHAYMALRKIQGSNDGYVLVLAGITPEAVDDAVISLGLRQVRFPDAAAAFINEVILPAAPPFFRQEPLQTEVEQTFAQLKENGTNFVALPTGGISCELFFPGFYRTDVAGDATVKIHFSARSRAFRVSSPLSLMFNGNDVGSGQYTTDSATGHSEAVFNIPVKQFLPGLNVLKIAVGGAAVSDLQIYSDSSLLLPKLPTDPRLPDLRLETRTFFPFIGQPDGSNLAVLVTDHRSETADAAFTFLARLAQSANTFFYAAQVTYDNYDPNRNVLAVGVYRELPTVIRNRVALEAFEEAHVNTPLAELESASSGVNLKRLISNWLHQNPDQVETQEQKQPATKQGPMLNPEDYGIIVSAPPLKQGQGWMMALTAFSSQALLKRTEAVVTPAFWDRVRGEIIRWSDTPESMQVHVPGEGGGQLVYQVEFPFGERLDYRVWIGLVALFFVLMIAMGSYVLGKLDKHVSFRQKET
jgi:cellulose synthase operon protein B